MPFVDDDDDARSRTTAVRADRSGNTSALVVCDRAERVTVEDGVRARDARKRVTVGRVFVWDHMPGKDNGKAKPLKAAKKGEKVMTDDDLDAQKRAKAQQAELKAMQAKLGAGGKLGAGLKKSK